MEQKPITVALAGNPNVGKSTIFNGLTGLKQHTGNWSGVTVAPAAGQMKDCGSDYLLVDLPGTYSLAVHSREEETARDFLSNGNADVIVVVCDATCPERGLRLLKQIVETDYVRDHGVPLILCVNLCDEARKKGVSIDFGLLQDVLQFPVVPCCARSAEDLRRLRETICAAAKTKGCYDCLDFSPKQLVRETVRYTRVDYRKREEIIDRIVTGRFTGSLIMIVLLLGLFWLTIVGANMPSDLLWDFFFSLEKPLASALHWIGAPDLLVNLLVYGAYRVLAWVVSVMLPPMAIFFPLFTLLEDLGYLPRVAFYMDRAFMRCRACGKQCLTMAMGLGCNAADRHPDQLHDSLQRPLPHADQPDYPVLLSRKTGTARRFSAGCPDADCRHSPGRGRDPALFVGAVPHGSERRSILLYAGTASLPPSADRQSDCPLHL